MTARLSLSACLFLFLVSSLDNSHPHRNVSLYDPLYLPHSNVTPKFQNSSLIRSLPSRNLISRRSLFALPDGACGPGAPCANGACCSKLGWCSYAPSSCAPENCISNCNAKAPCGQYALSESAKCPLNVCCSQHGFCGSTSDFCDAGCQTKFGGCGPPPTPSCTGNMASARTIGYYESWASTRKCDRKTPEDLDLTGLTHLNFAFAFFDPTSFQISPMDSSSASLYSRFTALKQKSPSLQTWISIGGWSFNDDTNIPNTRTAFSDMCSSAANRQTFISALTKFMVTYGFDGVDLDWEYPAADDRGGRKEDTINFVSLVREMRAAFGTRFGITATIPSSFWYMRHFDLKAMQEHLNWFNLMSYDIHGTWDSTNKFTGPFIRPHTNLTEIKDGMSLLWRAGVDPSKVVLGLGWYGRSFTLSDPSCSTPNGQCRFTGGGAAGSCTSSIGTLSNAEIFRIIAATGAKKTFDKAAGVKWINWNRDQWVSFDDGETIELKKQVANSLCLGGLMIWAVDQDNEKGESMSDLLGIGPANGVDPAKAAAYKQQFRDATLQNAIASSCYWSLCSEQCQSGYFSVAEARGQIAGIQRSSVCTGDAVQTLCCAPGTSMGKCEWNGFRGIGMPCSPACNDTDAVIVARNSNSLGLGKADHLEDLTCSGGYQAFCCSGFRPSTKANTGNMFLYGQGAFSNAKRDLIAIEIQHGKVGKIIGLTAVACAAAVAGMVAAAPFTFGLSLLGIPPEIAACAAAGIVVAAVGFAASGGGGKTQPHPSPPPVYRPATGVPTTITKGTSIRAAYGQWPILDFGTAYDKKKPCTCFVTYTCRYGMAWDEVCDNQRYGIDKILNGKTVFEMNTGRGGVRKYSSWANKQRAKQYRTAVQGNRPNRWLAACDLDEFPMGILKDSANNNPQACRLVNRVGNAAQGGDLRLWKLAQWTPCSAFLKNVCKLGPPPVTWAFGPNNRAPAIGKAFVTAYGFDRQTANSLCFPSYTYTDDKDKVQNTMIEDQGFRVLDDDPMFGIATSWPRRNYLIDPGPKKNSKLRPLPVNSAFWMKRDLQNLVANLTFEDSDSMSSCSADDHTDSDDILNYEMEDLDGNPIEASRCDVLYDDGTSATMLAKQYFGSESFATPSVEAVLTVASLSPTAQPSSGLKRSLGIPTETRGA